MRGLYPSPSPQSSPIQGRIGGQDGRFEIVSYWFIYCGIYLICFAGFSLFQWLYLGAWQPDIWMATLAAVSSASLGLALLAIILLEGVTYMVLFAPRRIKELIEKGRREGRQESDAAWEAWLQRRDQAREKGEPFDEPSPARRFGK